MPLHRWLEKHSSVTAGPVCQFLSFDSGHFEQDNSVLWGAVLRTGLYSPDTALQVMTTKKVFRHCWKSPWRQNCPRLNHCFILMTSNITWALGTACHHTAHPQFNHPPILLDDSFIPSLVSSSLHFLPACSLPADDLHREIEAIRVSSSCHHQTSEPAIFTFSPVTMLPWCVSLSRMSLQQCSRSGISPISKTCSFPQPETKQNPLDRKASSSYCPFLYCPLKN